MADYNKDVIIKDYLENGKGKYSSFHTARMKAAKDKGDNFPALMTLRKWLEEGGHLKPSEGGRVSKKTASATGAVSSAPLSEEEKNDFNAYDKNMFAAWVVSNKPTVWREYFSPEIKNEFLLSQKDREIADLKKQLEEAKRK